MFDSDTLSYSVTGWANVKRLLNGLCPVELLRGCGVDLQDRVWLKWDDSQ